MIEYYVYDEVPEPKRMDPEKNEVIRVGGPRLIMENSPSLPCEDKEPFCVCGHFGRNHETIVQEDDPKMLFGVGECDHCVCKRFSCYYCAEEKKRKNGIKSEKPIHPRDP